MTRKLVGDECLRKELICTRNRIGFICKICLYELSYKQCFIQREGRASPKIGIVLPEFMTIMLYSMHLPFSKVDVRPLEILKRFSGREAWIKQINYRYILFD
jgi:hypothetical protein